jgi:hypothetical protein
MLLYMRHFKTAEEVYDVCLSEGQIREVTEVDVERVKSLVQNAETSISAANIVIKAIKKDAKEWMNVYTCYYEALLMFTVALLAFDKVEITNHQCLFAYLCVKHPELELDWNFFEKVRVKTDAVNHYGQQISYADWKEIELQMNVYVGSLKREVVNRMKD